MRDNKSKVVTVHTMKAYGEETLSFHVLNLGTNWELLVSSCAGCLSSEVEHPLLINPYHTNVENRVSS